LTQKADQTKYSANNYWLMWFWRSMIPLLKKINLLVKRFFPWII